MFGRRCFQLRLCGAVYNLADLQCPNNSKIYYSFRFSSCLSEVSGFGDPSYKGTKPLINVCPFRV